MGINEMINTIRQERIVSILRGDSMSKILRAADALVEGGIRIVEFTFTNENPCKLIELNADKSDRIVGAGTVLSLEDAKSAVSAGAKFIVSPCTAADVVKYCVKNDILILPGVYTPTEVYNATLLGAKVLKLFPGSSGGIEHFKALKNPFPDIQVVPTGGVDTTNIKDWFKAGALAVGLGSNLAPKKLIADEKYDEIRKLAQTTVELAKT